MRGGGSVWTVSGALGAGPRPEVGPPPIYIFIKRSKARTYLSGGSSVACVVQECASKRPPGGGGLPSERFVPGDNLVIEAPWPFCRGIRPRPSHKWHESFEFTVHLAIEDTGAGGGGVAGKKVSPGRPLGNSKKTI